MTPPLLDTPVWLWWLLGQPELAARERTALDALAVAGTPPALSAISLWEAQILVDEGRLELDRPLTHWLPTAAAPETVTLLPIDVDVILALEDLPRDFAAIRQTASSSPRRAGIGWCWPRATPIFAARAA